MRSALWSIVFIMVSVLTSCSDDTEQDPPAGGDLDAGDGEAGDGDGGDACSDDCVAQAVCGDGTVQAGEACDIAASDTEETGCTSACEAREGYACDAETNTCEPVGSSGVDHELVAAELSADQAQAYCDWLDEYADASCSAQSLRIAGWCNHVEADATDADGLVKPLRHCKATLFELEQCAVEAVLDACSFETMESCAQRACGRLDSRASCDEPSDCTAGACCDGRCAVGCSDYLGEPCVDANQCSTEANPECLGVAAGFICTSLCDSDADCAADRFGVRGRCVLRDGLGGPPSACALACEVASDCGFDPADGSLLGTCIDDRDVTGETVRTCR